MVHQPTKFDLNVRADDAMCIHINKLWNGLILT